MMFEGRVLASTGKSSEAIERLTAGSIGYQSTGAASKGMTREDRPQAALYGEPQRQTMAAVTEEPRAPIAF